MNEKMNKLHRRNEPINDKKISMWMRENKQIHEKVNINERKRPKKTMEINTWMREKDQRKPWKLIHKWEKKTEESHGKN